MFNNFPRPIIFAHRGACANAPENTLAAFALAAEQGAPAIEFDVKLSADGEVVVIHDATVDRTTNGNGKVNQLSLSALKELDAGSFFSEKFKDEKIPTLDEVFEIFGKKLLMNIELTNYTTPFDGLADKVVALVEKYAVGERVLFSSFFPHNLTRARKLAPSIPCGQLSFPGIAGGWQRVVGNFLHFPAMHFHLTDATHSVIESAHRQNKRVHVWTVNDPSDMKRLFHFGADGIFTDNPALAVKVLNESK